MPSSPTSSKTLKISKPAMSSPSSLLLGPPGSRLLPQTLNNNPDYPSSPSAASPSLSFVSTGNPCLDFFFYVVPDTDSTNVVSLLASAWAHDPLVTLKLVCNLRGVRGTGKSDRGGFYACALWLHSHHPKTLALNLPAITGFGYLKDPLEILHRLIDPADVDTIRLKRKVPSNVYRRSKRNALASRSVGQHKGYNNYHSANRNELASRSVGRYNGDADYRFLHNRVTDLFVERLASDVEHLRAGRIGKIGLAAKWCPSLYSSFDRSTLLCESIARKMFPKDCDPDYVTIEDEHYAYRVRARLRKEVLVPLRKALELPEANMSTASWDALHYDVVPSVAMKNYAEHFLENDEDRFLEHLKNVKEGKAKIAAGALLPKEILNRDANVAELQWKKMVQDLSDKGRLRNCIAACGGLAEEAVVAFALLISELTDDPWKGQVMALCENPYFGRIEGESLTKRMLSMGRLRFGANAIDIQKVFGHLLQAAVEQKLEKENMIETVFVLVGKEFDGAALWTNDWETDYELVHRNFRESGYGDCVPQIVLWNVSGSTSSVPVAFLRKGVVLASGWSKNLLKFFLEGGKALIPEAVMEYAISGEEYRSLEVFD